MKVGVYSLSIDYDGANESAKAAEKAKWADAGAAGTLNLTVTAVASNDESLSGKPYAELLKKDASTAIKSNDSTNEVVESHTFTATISADGNTLGWTAREGSNAQSTNTGNFAVRARYTATSGTDYDPFTDDNGGVGVETNHMTYTDLLLTISKA